MRFLITFILGTSALLLRIAGCRTAALVLTAFVLGWALRALADALADMRPRRREHRPAQRPVRH